jgi:glyoxylase I family protein
MTPQVFSGIHHVAIISSDYAASKQFYVNVFQAEIVSEVYREERDSYKLNLRLSNNIEIELFSFPSPPARPSYPEACGLRHLAFAVPDLDKAISWVQSFGAKTEPIRIDAYTGARFTFLSDPDGTPLELYEVKPG